MKLKSTFKSAVGVVTLLALNSTVNAEDFYVDSKASYYDAVSQVGPGDDIVFKNGTYRDFEIKFQAQGSKQAPVTLRAETKGEVVFSVTNSHFETISGNVFAFNKEKDDLGIYNVEVLNISNSVFENVSGALALIYRGGTDESTFGPKVTLSDNTLTKVGHGKRNKRKASIFLHGVQKTNIRNNTFDSSAKVRIEHTVGEPQTTLSQNSFSNTDKPSIIDFLTAKDGCQCQ
ncbi:MAG: hypothetical protein GYB34_14290 [Gammaproteobacteria bacterium]|nr:hypothetical protein [Gammaproteobacteria bacterium]